MLRTIAVTIVVLVALLLLAVPGPVLPPLHAAQPAQPEETLVDGDKMVAEIATELAADDNGGEATWTDGPPPLFAGIPPRHGPPLRLTWSAPEHFPHALASRPLLPPPRIAA